MGRRSQPGDPRGKQSLNQSASAFRSPDHLVPRRIVRRGPGKQARPPPPRPGRSARLLDRHGVRFLALSRFSAFRWRDCKLRGGWCGGISSRLNRRTFQRFHFPGAWRDLDYPFVSSPSPTPGPGKARGNRREYANWFVIHRAGSRKLAGRNPLKQWPDTAGTTPDRS